MRSGGDEGELFEHLHALPEATTRRDEPLAGHTRFGLGGPADLLFATGNVESFTQALQLVRERGVAWVVVGGGSNLIVADAGFRGVVLKLENRQIDLAPSGGDGVVRAGAGARLQDLVDETAAGGWRGLETMTGIPGWTGAAVYGNAGAYGRSISESIWRVTFFDGQKTREADNAGCRFRYRESIFKANRDWIIVSVALRLERADARELQRAADEILTVRNRKYPPEMKCAGSIFKNLLFGELPGTVQERVPAALVREGKVPAAWFLEQVGAKGLRRGGIVVADYHANLIYNDGGGTARELVEVIRLLQERVRDEFGMEIEEEVQYVGDVFGDCRGD